MRQLTDPADWQDKKVLVRIDTDVDIVHGKVVDDSRLRAALPTIRWLHHAGAVLTLIGHCGRPGGKVDPSLSLEPVAKLLAHLLVPGSHLKTEKLKTDSVVTSTRYILGKDVVLLENLRFDAGEEANEPEFVGLLAAGQDRFVNESFAAHRKSASVGGVAKKLPSYAGLRLVDELAHLDILREAPKKPFTLIVGGAKMEEKLGLLDHLLPKVNFVLTGGVVANIFLQASGVDIKDSVTDSKFVALAEKLLKGERGHKIILPTDYVWRHEMIIDIGPETIEKFLSVINDSQTLFWAGTMGRVEEAAGSHGSRAVAETLAKHKGVRIVGGGDTAVALAKFHLTDKMSFVSTGGGAALEYLAGQPLPGVEVLS